MCCGQVVFFLCPREKSAFAPRQITTACTYNILLYAYAERVHSPPNHRRRTNVSFIWAFYVSGTRHQWCIDDDTMTTTDTTRQIFGGDNGVPTMRATRVLLYHTYIIHTSVGGTARILLERISRTETAAPGKFDINIRTHYYGMPIYYTSHVGVYGRLHV